MGIQLLVTAAIGHIKKYFNIQHTWGFNCWLPQQLDISRNTLIYNTYRKYRRRKNVFCYRTVLPNAIRRNFLTYFFIIWTKRANQEGYYTRTTQFIGPTPC